jgi:uncharacterized protein YcfL/F0F1-type ATP synthase assembly protein I
MKKYLLLIISALLLAACSSPKYTYHFDHYDYNSGKKKLEIPSSDLAQTTLVTPETSPLTIDQEALTASAESRVTKVEAGRVTLDDQALLKKKYAAMSKTEKKEFRKELKSEIKKMIKAKKSGESITSVADTKVMDHDLKMALIFGVVGIVLSAFGGVNSVFWILGIISTVIAIVFLIKWLAEQ